VLVAFGFLVVLPTLASAEWFVDVYAGGAFNRHRVSRVGTTASVEKSYETATGGARFGYFFEKEPWLGFAVDGSAFRAAKDVTLVPLSVLIMLRFPLFTSQQSPKGLLQPYFGIGPGVFISKADTTAAGGTFSDTAVDVGLDLRAGLAWPFLKNIAAFGEYRLTHVEPEYDGQAGGVPAKFETRARTHHVLGGISIRF
jgi:opacity protein-like surface antigen